MRTLRMLALCVLAALVLGSVAAAGASAAAPEYGRCLKQAKGKFENGACTKEGPGKFEWFAGVIKNKFTTASKESTLITFEFSGGTKIVCRGEKSPGEYSGAKTVSEVKLTFTSCETAGIPCNTAGQPEGKITTAPLSGELVVLKPGKLGQQLAPAGGQSFTEFECTGVEKVVVRGSLTYPVPANSMKLSYTIKLTHVNGLEASINGAPFEGLTLTATLILTNEEKVEASTVN